MSAWIRIGVKRRARREVEAREHQAHEAGDQGMPWRPCPACATPKTALDAATLTPRERPQASK